MRRFSLRAAMAAVIFVALGLAALRSATPLWAGMVLGATLLAIGVAVLGVATSRGRARAAWLGFATFAGGYLYATAGEGLPAHTSSTLPTSMLIEAVVGAMRAETLDLAEQAMARQTLQSLVGGTSDMMMGGMSGQPAVVMADGDAEARRLALTTSVFYRIAPRSAAKAFFPLVAQCLFAALFGLAGAAIGARLHAAHAPDRPQPAPN